MKSCRRTRSAAIVARVSYGILSGPSLRGAYTPRIDLGPECVPGFPCSEAAEHRQELERGLTAFLARSRTGVDPFRSGSDPLLEQYQTSLQTLAHEDPAYAAILAQEAGHIARTSADMHGRLARLSRSQALHGPYYMVPLPPATIVDYADTGLPLRLLGQKSSH